MPLFLHIMQKADFLMTRLIFAQQRLRSAPDSCCSSSFVAMAPKVSKNLQLENWKLTISIVKLQIYLEFLNRNVLCQSQESCTVRMNFAQTAEFHWFMATEKVI